MAPSLGLRQWAKGAQKPYFAVLCYRTYTIESPFSYFPNSFYETFVNKDKKGKTRQGDCARMCKKEKAPLVAEPSSSA